MKLIKKIEVNYFRSLHTATLTQIGDLNVIFGRNDSGKSNLLRALNLFFNGYTDVETDLDFDLDFSDIRKIQAQEGKSKQFIWIKVTFSVPDNYSPSLGKEIWVKRQWNRLGDMTETVGTTKENHNQARLTRFLNDIDFTYIPAIKDIDVFGDLIERIYAAASETTVIQKAARDFVSAIGTEAQQLTSDLGKMMGAPARLSEPTQMAELFRNLDFSHGSEEHSLLRQKGDGIKARHIPELLRFINESESRSKFYLWGFEEPENSLDLGAAELEAERFREFAQRVDTQAFITSHSPAFYLVADNSTNDVRRYFVSKQHLSSQNVLEPSNAIKKIDTIDAAESEMQEAGLFQLPFVIRRLGDLDKALSDAQTETEELRKRLGGLRKPTLFVEGPTDVRVFERSIVRLGLQHEVAVKAMGGSAKKDSNAIIANLLIQGDLNASQPALLLFDNDKKGREAFKKLSKSTVTITPQETQSNHILTWVLQETDEFQSFIERFDIPNHNSFFPIEFCFPAKLSAEVCAKIIESHGQDFSDWLTTIHGDYYHHLKQDLYVELLKFEQGTPEWLYSRGVPDKIKAQYLENIQAEGGSMDAIDRVAEASCKALLQLTE